MSEIQIGDMVTVENWGGTEIVRNIVTDKDGLRFAIFDHGGFWRIAALRKVAADAVAANPAAVDAHDEAPVVLGHLRGSGESL